MAVQIQFLPKVVLGGGKLLQKDITLSENLRKITIKFSP